MCTTRANTPPPPLQLPPEQQGNLAALLQLTVRSASGALVPIRELVTVSDTLREQPVFTKGPAARELRGGRHGRQGRQPALRHVCHARRHRPIAHARRRHAGRIFHPPAAQDAWRGYALKWDGEWQITYETFRDMGAAMPWAWS